MLCILWTMYKKYKDIISEIIAFIVSLSFVAFIIFAVVKCSQGLDAKRDFELKYGIEHPMYYEITFTDSRRDTIIVWTNPDIGDCIEMYNNGGTFTDGKVVLTYTLYDKYTMSEPRKVVNLYNVLYYKKLKTR